jgi:Tfp pilus assembly protein PilF
MRKELRLITAFLLPVMIAFRLTPTRAQDLPNELKPYAKEAVQHYNHAVELHQSGNLDQAEAEYKAAVEADQRMIEAFENLAALYAAEHKSKEANESMNKATSVKKETAVVIDQYGEQLQSAGKTEQAITEWNKALRLDPTLASARKHLEAAGAKIIEDPKPYPSF